MVQVAPVTLQYNPKTLWFDPRGLDIRKGDRVIVSTERGVEFGLAGDLYEASEEEVASLNGLKPVLRIATEEDVAYNEELRGMGREALGAFKRLAAETNEDMHPVLVEYLFDGEKAVFYFESEERVDFRELVRKLAAEFHVRVDMRQIGVRDEARLIGGLGHCGQELCCRRLGGEFCPVSIRMAKEQDLSLNPSKISGVCGRLMCCLRYEYDTYKEFKGRCPKMNSKVSTPAGPAKVVSLDMPRERVKLRLEEGGKNVTVPLSAMDEPAAGSARPNSIGDAFEQYANPDPFGSSSAVLFDTSSFTREDKLATPEAHRNPPARRTQGKDVLVASSGRSGRRRRSKRVNAGGSEGSAAANAAGAQEKREASAGASRRSSNRRRGSHKVANDIDSEQARSAAKSKQRKEKVQSQKAQAQRKRSGARPGQKSSGLRAEQGKSAVKKAAPDNKAASGQSMGEPSVQHRRQRRRSHKSGGASDES